MKKIFLFLSLVLIFADGASAQRETQPEPTAANKTVETEDEKKPKYEVQFHFSQESLTRDLGTWRTASLYIERKFANRQTVWANFRASSRNGSRDQEFVAGTYKAFRSKWAATVEAMYSPTHRYVGKFSLMGEIEKGLKRGFVAHFGSRYTAYNTVKATTVYGLGEKYWGNNRAAYTLYLTKLTDAGTAPTHRLQYNRYWGENVNSFGATVSFGREHENLGPNVGVLRNNTWSVSGSGRFWLTKKFGLNVDGWVHRQGNLYYRRGLNFGIRYRF